MRGVALPLVAGVVVLLSGTVAVVRGQDALGDGRALDNNLRMGSGGRNDAGRDIRAELAFRNAIVTGNVGGGREFRGSVGYTATDDFRGFLGSNASFQFERDSFYSGLATRNLSGIDSIRNPLAYTVAGQRDGVFGGGLIVNRSGTGATAGQVDGSMDPRTQGTDVFGNISGTLRSPSMQVSRWQRMPDLIAYTTEPDESGTFDVMSASPLIGIKSMRSDSPLFNPDESERRRERARAALPGTGLPGERDPAGAEAVRPPSPHQVVLESLRGEPAAVRLGPEIGGIGGIEAAEGAPEAPAGSPVIDGAGAPAEEDTTGLRANQLSMPAFDRNLENLRVLLRETQVRAMQAEAPRAKTDVLAGREEGEESDEGDAEDRRPRTAPELAAEILAGKSALVMDLAVVPTDDELFAEHMRRGQEMLRAERWFNAEERFTAALAIRPGDPMAAAARVNAQIAAGMYRSAAVNLRNLFGAYPEMMVTRFDGSLVGPPDRIEVVATQLRERMETASPLGRDSALLLAAVGYQTQNVAMMVEAFERLRVILEEMGTRPDTLERTLFAVWVAAPPDSSPESAPTPEPGP